MYRDYLECVVKDNRYCPHRAGIQIRDRAYGWDRGE